MEANQSPTVQIMEPMDGSVFQEGSQVNFMGTGTDPEEGELQGAMLVWTSDKDGQIGTGDQPAFFLSDGSSPDHFDRY